MKKILILFFSICYIEQTYCQDKITEPTEEINKNVFYFSPFHLFTNTFQIGYERETGSKGNSFALMGGIILKDSDTEYKQGGSGELHLRISLLYSENKRHKLYWGPYVKYLYMYRKESTDFLGTDWDSAIIRTGSGGIVAGYRICIAKTLNFNFYLGGGVQYSDNIGSISKYENIFGPGYTGVLPFSGFQIGLSL